MPNDPQPTELDQTRAPFFDSLDQAGQLQFCILNRVLDLPKACQVRLRSRQAAPQFLDAPRLFDDIRRLRLDALLRRFVGGPP